MQGIIVVGSETNAECVTGYIGNPGVDPQHCAMNSPKHHWVWGKEKKNKTVSSYEASLITFLFLCSEEQQTYVLASF